jgi:hypothetical protein
MGIRVMRWLVKLVSRLLIFSLLSLVIIFLLQYSTIPLGDPWRAVGFITQDYQFDYLSWEAEALSGKIYQTLYGLHPFMTEEDRAQFVRNYMLDLQRAQQLENEVNGVFSDPAVGDPEAASANLRAERDALRADLSQRQLLAEAILEGQVATILIEQGFGIGGQLFPPISAHFTQMPNLLVVSPRDEIRFEVGINLDPMPVDVISQVEDRIDQQQDASSLIVPLGGIALYPSMILETTSIPRALDVIAHEWSHHYLFLFPLGYQYDLGNETRIINETTASLFGREIGPLVLARYYPDLVASGDTRLVRGVGRNVGADKGFAFPSVTGLVPTTLRTEHFFLQDTQELFDYGRAMDETRRTVDALLAEGKVEEAEAYMEERRQVFLDNGYLIRKLNQAFFAFYGGYQSGAPGVGGEDPIGPAVQTIYDASPSILDWMVTMREITTREELLAVRDELQSAEF